MNPKVQIQIVTYNSSEHLEQLFAGIKRQTGVDFEVLVIDNNSRDDSVHLVREYYPQARIIQNKENRGFGSAHNQGFETCESAYVLVLNPDTELQENFLREAVNMIESDSAIASVGGVLYQQLPEQGKSGVIDSLGLKQHINGQIVDIAQNKPQNAKMSLKTDVFGITGACALYRLSALKQVKDEYGILDKRFGLYSLKDDADLAWRLHNAGFKAKIALNAIAYHARGTGKSDARKNRSDEVKQTSIRNHILMLKKNLKPKDMLWRSKFILGYELAKFIYTLIFETRNLKAYKVLWNSPS